MRKSDMLGTRLWTAVATIRVVAGADGTAGRVTVLAAMATSLRNAVICRRHIRISFIRCLLESTACVKMLYSAPNHRKCQQKSTLVLGPLAQLFSGLPLVAAELAGQRHHAGVDTRDQPLALVGPHQQATGTAGHIGHVCTSLVQN
jgi:hypothetical protein